MRDTLEHGVISEIIAHADLREFDSLKTEKIIGNYMVTITVERLEGVDAESGEKRLN